MPIWTAIYTKALPAGRDVKPVVPYQHRFSNFYVFGTYTPVSGYHFTLEMPYCKMDCFEANREALSGRRPCEVNVIILGNGAFRKAQRLIIPLKIALHFLSPYSPELNPAEQIWRYIQDRLANQVFDSLGSLEAVTDQILNALTAPKLSNPLPALVERQSAARDARCVGSG